jgi:hypothetical protein
LVTAGLLGVCEPERGWTMSHNYKAKGKPDAFLHCLGRGLPERFHWWVVVQGRDIVFRGDGTVEACSRWLNEEGYALDVPKVDRRRQRNQGGAA